jgi:hypothetical protein
MSKEPDVPQTEEERLVADILDSRSSQTVVSTTLRTDERVIARVTDGIYRQPASALRELISNSYDADATRVVVNTDAPRFSQIIVEDNGHGMSPQVVAHLLLHIGGSAKRSEQGQQLGVTASSDPTKSPHGRKLIGKIGIGLFSVSQLTHSFQIVTKVKGDKFRTVATVSLKQFSDNVVEAADGEDEFESGKVNIWREPAVDVDAHGTTIVLTNIRPQARDTLRSREIWAAIEQAEKGAPDEEKQDIEPPKFHVGRVDPASGDLIKKSGGKFDALPWEKGDDPTNAFRRMVDSVWEEVYKGDANPQLERIFDYYLRMIWQLSLAVPLPYVDGHLFDLELSDKMPVFRLSNSPRGLTEDVALEEEETLRTALSLKDPESQQGVFDVFFDEVKLLRPIKFLNLPMTQHALKTPLVFLGKCREEFPGVAAELSGGPLDFEAYLFWTPKVAPTEHQGSLIRIHGSSGTLFDPTFMRYQVSEQTRLRQITCEIFVREGLDSALNIDRESFNNAHPHSVYITRWLHNALRQLATTQKRLGRGIRSQVRQENQERTAEAIQQVAVEIWKENTQDEAEYPPDVLLTDDTTGQSKPQLDAGSYMYSRSALLADAEFANSEAGRSERTVLEEKLKAIAQVLASFGLLDKLSPRKQERLLQAISRIISRKNE